MFNRYFLFRYVKYGRHVDNYSYVIQTPVLRRPGACVKLTIVQILCEILSPNLVNIKFCHCC